MRKMNVPPVENIWEGISLEAAYQEEGMFSLKLLARDDNGLFRTVWLRIRIPPEHFLDPTAYLRHGYYQSVLGPAADTLRERDLPEELRDAAWEHIDRGDERFRKFHHHMEQYGDEMFQGRAEVSLPASFAKEAVAEIVSNLRKDKRKLSAVQIQEKFVKYRLTGLNKIGAGGRGLRVCNINMTLFKNAVNAGYIKRKWEGFSTNWDISNKNDDDIMSAVDELTAIRQTIKKWKRKEWPPLDRKIFSKIKTVDDLKKTPRSNSEQEIYMHFLHCYFLILKFGENVKLPKPNFEYQEKWRRGGTR